MQLSEHLMVAASCNIWPQWISPEGSHNSAKVLHYLIWLLPTSNWLLATHISTASFVTKGYRTQNRSNWLARGAYTAPANSKRKSCINIVIIGLGGEIQQIMIFVYSLEVLEIKMAAKSTITDSFCVVLLGKNSCFTQTTCKLETIAVTTLLHTTDFKIRLSRE